MRLLATVIKTVEMQVELHVSTRESAMQLLSDMDDSDFDRTDNIDYNVSFEFIEEQ